MRSVSTARKLHHSYDDYLHALEISEIKLEYWDGAIYAMAGGTGEHSALAAKITALLDARLPAGCRAFTSDMKIKIPTANVSVFPDVSIVCGKIEWADGKQSILNPGLIVEVTSPSTEQDDRGDKLDVYKTVKSLQAIWIVSQSQPRVTVIERHQKKWRTSEQGRGDQLTLATPPLTIDVDAIYRVLDEM
jgi:Uma2 family endonuclease